MSNVKEETKKRYEIGDFVIYRAEGICDIVDIKRQSFAGGEKADYYILSPRNDPNSTVYVPVDNDRLTAMMRPLLTEREIRELILELRNDRLNWIPDSRARNTRFKDILSEGDRRKLIVLLQTVRDKIAENDSIGKRSGTTETGAMIRACRLLREEFSPAIPLSNDAELLDLIDSVE